MLHQEPSGGEEGWSEYSQTQLEVSHRPSWQVKKTSSLWREVEDHAFGTAVFPVSLHCPGHVNVPPRAFVTEAFRWPHLSSCNG